MQFLEMSQSIDLLTRSYLNLATLIEISPTWDDYLTKLSYNGIKVKLSTRFDEMLKHTDQFLMECMKKKIRSSIKETKLIWFVFVFYFFIYLLL